ncbi:hypothetical protein OHB26_07000 [Nocardia sp. NBC_01503]|uniref:hypothetical protein n=1 Tax=Nocardia sp. NBC_01503 TaxID=2975997 RepID=UPI002E7C3441|nr:hypothetical protein [Nocardia sp. NBC_01503]WTL33957.1 hypothetical protein OHB26_07000 [Nocardia sp. NBC_01503]
MNDRLQSYKDLLRTASNKTGAVRDGIDTIIDTLITTTNGRGEPWGNDTMGKGFADGDNGYVKSSGNIIDGARNMSGTFANFSKGQKDALELLTRMDDGNGDQFK